MEDGYDFEVSTGTSFSYNNWLEGEVVPKLPIKKIKKVSVWLLGVYDTSELGQNAIERGISCPILCLFFFYIQHIMNISRE